MIKTYSNNRIKRHIKIRSQVIGSHERPRLAVFRSSAHIYAQLIDDDKGVTMGAASDSKMTEKMTKLQKAELVGTEIAKVGKAAKIIKVVFDRGGFAYHGRVKAVAEGARKGGLEF